jgi:hypothetical protein
MAASKGFQQMRDIRVDLEDRAQLLKEQIKAAQDAFDRQMETIEREHENKVREFRTTLDAVNTVLRRERHMLSGAQAPDAQSKAPRTGHARPPADLKKKLADFIVRELGHRGSASKDDLLKLAVRQGHLADGDSSECTLEETLAQSKKAGSIRQLPNGNFALSTVAETIGLRRVG